LRRKSLKHSAIAGSLSQEVTKQTMKSLMVCSLAVVLAGGTAIAQEMPRFTGKVGAGFTQPTGTAEDRLDRGWNLGLEGAGVNFSPHTALMGD
jgi:hypothetical protein